MSASSSVSRFHGFLDFTSNDERVFFSEEVVSISRFHLVPATMSACSSEYFQQKLIIGKVLLTEEVVSDEIVFARFSSAVRVLQNIFNKNL